MVKVQRYAEAEPWPRLPVWALSGRSNVGKSSLLNALLGVRAAAVSQQPGRTRNIFLYHREGERYLWADLPGYGYARASQEQRRAWLRAVQAFLRRVRPFVWVLVDSRLPPQPIDQAWVRYLEGEGLAYGLLATKADALTQKLRHRQKQVFMQAYPRALWQGWVSARTGEGLPALRAWIEDGLARASNS